MGLEFLQSVFNRGVSISRAGTAFYNYPLPAVFHENISDNVDEP
ncbi:MAG: hypothetical protein ACI90G_002809, partial [Urechidicola sp.]